MPFPILPTENCAAASPDTIKPSLTRQSGQAVDVETTYFVRFRNMCAI